MITEAEAKMTDAATMRKAYNRRTGADVRMTAWDVYASAALTGLLSHPGRDCSMYANIDEATAYANEMVARRPKP